MTALVMASCTGDGEAGDGPDATPTRSADDAGWEVLAGVELITVTGLERAQPVTLYGTDDEELITVIADELGQAAFPLVPDEPLTVSAGPDFAIPDAAGGTLQAGDYYLADDTGEPRIVTETIRVLDVDDTADPDFYASQELVGLPMPILGDLPEGVEIDDGFQYLEMRDGVRLSANVRFPDPALYGEGPWPTVIVYSGYSPSNPGEEGVESRLARSLGYATVSVNIRGSGCSGGIFDLFPPNQHADGYDMVEIVAAQDWALHGHVGMVGVSYPGVSQIMVAATAPPNLASITPSSVFADTWEQLWPGGVYNAGLTSQWIGRRDQDASAGGTDWVAERVESGDDPICASHMDIRNLNIEFESFSRSLENRPRDADDRDMRRLVGQIEVPVLIAGTLNDEQTGAQWTAMLDEFDRSPLLKASIANGRHPDALAPFNLIRWYEFLEFTVAERVPQMNPIVRAALAPEIAKAFDVEDVELEGDRWFDRYGNDYEAARAAWEAEAPVRFILDSGAGANEAGEPTNPVELAFSTWPTPEAEHRTFWLDDGEGLSADAPTTEGNDRYAHDPQAGATGTLVDDVYDIEAATWDFDWTEFPGGSSVSYLTEPFTNTEIAAGPGYADLWMRTEVDSANVQVAITEVRPDGVEHLVQLGFLNLEHRAFEETSGDTRVARTFAVEDREKIKPGEWMLARIEIPTVGHVFRPGSQLRLIVSTPGRSHPTGEYENPEYDGAEASFDVHRGGQRASAVVIPFLPRDMVDAVEVSADRPPCPALRGMACRQFTPARNQDTES